MKTKTTLTLLAITALLFFCTSCEEENGSIVIDNNISSVVFDYGAPTSRTITFSSTAPWNITMGEQNWVKVEPTSGKAGDAQIEIILNEPTTEITRKGLMTIHSGETMINVVIEQKPLEAIAINAPQTKIVQGGSMPFAAVALPSNAKLEGVQWESTSPEIGTIDSDGNFKAVSVGSTTINAQYKEIKTHTAIYVTDKFMTDGRGANFTLEDLSNLYTSGVTVENGTAKITADITIDAKDQVSAGDVTQIIINNGITIRVEGFIDISSENRISCKVTDPSESSVKIYMPGDKSGGCNVENTDFSGVYFRYFGEKPMTATNCTFENVTKRDAVIGSSGKAEVVVIGCTFKNNYGPAVAGGANIPTAVRIEDCMLENNSYGVRNRPQLNLTVAGDKEVIIKNTTVIGPAEITPNGGISVANMMGIGGTNKVTVDNCTVRDCRYGLTFMGCMDATVTNNTLKDNHYESNPMNGGSGVAINYSGGPQIIKMRGNTITNHLWGITYIDWSKGQEGQELDLGRIGNGIDDPGNNVFKDNGNNGVLYDFYNNSPYTIYAQGNTWNVETQDEESIEQVIVHKADFPNLGEVIFMPAK